MNRIFADLVIQRDGKIRASVLVNGIEVHAMTFKSNQMVEAQKWLDKVEKMERERE